MTTTEGLCLIHSAQIDRLTERVRELEGEVRAARLEAAMLKRVNLSLSRELQRERQGRRVTP